LRAIVSLQTDTLGAWNRRFQAEARLVCEEAKEKPLGEAKQVGMAGRYPGSDLDRSTAGAPQRSWL